MWQKSREWTAGLGPALVLALLACSAAYSQDVRTNSMPGTDFSKYHRYAWVDEVKGVPRVGGQPDQILDAQIKQAVDAQMAAKGFTKVVDSEKADIVLGYQLAIDREKQVNGFADGWGGWGPWGGGLNSLSATTSLSTRTEVRYEPTFFFKKDLNENSKANPRRGPARCVESLHHELRSQRPYPN